MSCERQAEMSARRVMYFMGATIPQGSCWILKDDRISFQRKDRGKAYWIRILRWLGFLQNPTDANWHAPTDQELRVPRADSRDTPFCHDCHNRHTSRMCDEGKRKLPGCIADDFSADISNMKGVLIRQRMFKDRSIDTSTSPADFLKGHILYRAKLTRSDQDQPTAI